MEYYKGNVVKTTQPPLLYVLFINKVRLPYNISEYSIRFSEGEGVGKLIR